MNIKPYNLNCKIDGAAEKSFKLELISRFMYKGFFFILFSFVKNMHPFRASSALVN